MKTDNATFYIKEGEFYFLMAALGRTTFFGISSEETGVEKSWDKKEKIYRMLISLYQKGYVDWEGDYIHLCEPVKSIMMCLKESHDMQLIHKERGTIACYEVEHGYVLVEKSPLEKEMLKITALEGEEFFLKERKRWNTRERRKVSTGVKYDID